MLHKQSVLFVLIAACLLTDVSSRPSNNESGPFKVEIPGDAPPQQAPSEEPRSIYYQADPGAVSQDDATVDIVDKIKAINDGLKKPNRHQINFNKPPATEYVIDKDILEKIQQAIASGILHTSTFELTQRQQETNDIQKEEENFKRYLNSRALKQAAGISPVLPYPYIITVPVVVMPQHFEPQNRFAINNEINSMLSNQVYQTRQESTFPNFPSFPSFQNIFQWPFAQFFPLIIKDPFLAFSQSGGLNNLIEYGQNADVCTRKQKSAIDAIEENDSSSIIGKDIDIAVTSDLTDGDFSREARVLKKRNVNQRLATPEKDNEKQSKKIYVTTKPVAVGNTKIRATKKPYVVQEVEEVKNEESADLRFPFGDFSWFGNKKPVAPSPGFFINKLRVRKGGVAIAGPGGVATAGRGGTAIVGPGGLAYTQPGGLAVAGPAARVVALAPDVDLNALVARLQREDDPSVPRSHQPIREGKVVATGPVVFYHPTEQTYPEAEGRSTERDDGQYPGDSYYYEGSGVSGVSGMSGAAGAGFVVQLRPQALAVSGARGAAIATPVSRVLVGAARRGAVVHRPLATAVAGPGGIAHALSELYIYDDDATGI